MVDTPFLQRVHRDLVWPRAPWVREVFVGLSEASWVGVPPDLLMELRHVARCPKSTKLAEDGFNALRDRGRHRTAGQQGMRMRLSNLLTSGLLEDSGVRPLKKECVSQSHVVAVPSGIFEATSNEAFSLGAEYTQKYLHIASGELSASRYMQAALGGWRACAFVRALRRWRDCGCRCSPPLATC